jgi:hypothetical protein
MTLHYAREALRLEAAAYRLQLLNGLRPVDTKKKRIGPKYSFTSARRKEEALTDTLLPASGLDMTEP